MTRVREDIWKDGDDWTPTLRWYARAVGEMQSRPLHDRTSWRYLAAIHGFNEGLWQQVGRYAPGVDRTPPPSEMDQAWRQCQHATWYFLPWHRGYLLAFERIVADTIVRLGGPPGWALPYWNYSDPKNANALFLHPAFREPLMQDGTANPLFVQQRYGVQANGRLRNVGSEDYKLDALLQQRYVAVPCGSEGLGGGRTPFRHATGDGQKGALESTPHDKLHVVIGARDGMQRGLMAVPVTAALDPIFWVHHANIDRLWEIWLRRDPRHRNPIDEKNWMQGPSDRAFVMPTADGRLEPFRAEQLLDIGKPPLDYTYQDLSDPFGGATRKGLRIQRLGAGIENFASRETAMGDAADDGDATRRAELIGASGSLRIAAATDASVRMDPHGRDAVGRNLRRFKALGVESLHTASEPDRVFLRLEGITGNNDAARLAVYLNLPENADPAQYPERLAGTVALFGVSDASGADGPHAGNGLDAVLEVTDLVDALDRDGDGLPAQLSVRVVPLDEVLDEDDIQVARIGLYREFTG
jgi:tyrosinase